MKAQKGRRVLEPSGNPREPSERSSEPFSKKTQRSGEPFRTIGSVLKRSVTCPKLARVRPIRNACTCRRPGPAERGRVGYFTENPCAEKRNHPEDAHPRRKEEH